MAHVRNFCAHIKLMLFCLIVHHQDCVVECREIQSYSSLQFFAIGDWGGQLFSPYTTKVERAVAKEMGIMADYFKPDFILALGM